MKKITREELMAITNEELMAVTRNCAVDLHLLNGSVTQLCVNDLQVFD